MYLLKNFMNRLLIVIALVSLLFVLGCEVEAPVREDVPELITKVTLTFTPTDGEPLIVTASDPDGEGVQDVQVDGDIRLQSNKTYTLTLSLTTSARLSPRAAL